MIFHAGSTPARTPAVTIVPLQATVLDSYSVKSNPGEFCLDMAPTRLCAVNYRTLNISILYLLPFVLGRDAADRWVARCARQGQVIYLLQAHCIYAYSRILTIVGPDLHKHLPNPVSQFNSQYTFH